jgi:glycosyltransferase involved in cell wall biosynthesis
VPRVLMVVEPAEGGTAEMVAALAAGLPGHGFEGEVAGPAGAPRYAELGVPVHGLPLAPGYGPIRDDAAAARGLAQVVRRRRPDLVHTHSAKAGVIGRPVAAALRVPALHSPHCFPFLTLQYSARRRALAARVERVLAPLARTIVCVCEDERREALARRIAGPGRLAVIHNGVAACPGGLAVPRALGTLGAGGPVAATVSVLREQKRVDVFLEAAPLVLRRAPDARLAVVGNGPLHGELEAQAARLGLLADERFAFLPFEPPMARWLAGIDCFVLPSDYEAFPVAILEALACGVAQVATAVGGVGEAVTADTGVLVPPRDQGALAEAIVAVLGDPDRRARMSAASVRRHAEHFRLDRMGAATARVYEAALAR